MKISYHWLKRYINLSHTAEEISKILTSIGLEVGGVEHIQSIKGGLEGVVTGEVLQCAPHENADHLHVTVVDVGLESPLQIVCGAPNVATGQKVMVATIGTKLWMGDDCITIKKSKIRGVESHGMICAEDELGIGSSHDGIIVLPKETEVGIAAKEYYGISDDYIFEIDITPNRIDAASHYGIARDLAAYFALHQADIQLTKPTVDAFEINNTHYTIPVTVENTEACPRYAGVVISDVSVRPSPQWLQDRLQSIGVRSINNIVDVTNFVLHELGQPLHAFDAHKINGSRVVVKNVANGTSFVSLDGIERRLDATDLMICDATQPLCIGGVFGGINSGVTEDTTHIFLECAYFNPVSIRKTARRHGLNTDASFRFERGCDPNHIEYVLKRCALLIQEVAGGSISSAIQDVYPQPIYPYVVHVSLQKINTLIGQNIEKETIERILTALEIDILAFEDNVYELSVPTYRVDVQRDVDVIEEILRIYGYNRIEMSNSINSHLSYSKKPDSHHYQQLISEQLTGQGFNEILNNSLTKCSYYDALQSFPASHCVKILNPLSADLNCMRQTLIFGGLENIAYNVNRKNADLKLYEFGNNYHFNATNRCSGDPLAPYNESFHLGIWLTGQKQAQSWSIPSLPTTVFELKAYVINIMKRLGVNLTKVNITPGSSDLFHESIEFSTNSGKLLAVLGSVHPRLLKQCDVNQPVYFAELQWNHLMKSIQNNQVQSSDIPKFPEVRRDLALLLDQVVPFAALEKIAFQTEKKLLKKVTLFDVYEGKNIEAGKKSYALSFILQDETKTLTDDQIETIMRKIQKNFEDQLGAKLR